MLYDVPVSYTHLDVYKRQPGGYYSYPQTLEQFHVSDERKAVEVERDLKKLGREPVWKDWDQSFDFKR